jgi:hypothetical protein
VSSLQFLSHVVVADGTVWALGPVDQTSLGVVRYDPGTDRWVPGPTLADAVEAGWTATIPALFERPALWTGTQIVLWDPLGGGPAFNPIAGTWGWLPAPEPPTGRILTSAAVMTERGLVAVAEVEESGRSHFATATLTAAGWIWGADNLPLRDLDTVTIAAAGKWLAFFGRGQSPTTLNLSSGQWVVHTEGPLGGLEAPAAVWTGHQLVVWGGEASATPTIDSPPSGAVWTPPSRG